MNSCVRCHFLCKVSSSPALTFETPLNEEDRYSILAMNKGYFSIRPTTLLCSMGVWDQASLNIDINKRFDFINNENRKDQCFFFEFRPSMNLEAAETMQKREQENTLLLRSHRHTRIGLYFAAGGLFLNAIAYLTGLYFNYG